VTWIDSHCHVSADAFDADRDEVLARAWEAGVEALLAVGAGWGIDANERALELAARDERVFAAVGVHPHDARLLDDAGRERIRAWLGHPRVVAVGECGLDYFRDLSPRPAQVFAFERQLALATVVAKPVFLHQRDAHADFLAILREQIGALAGGVAHCFTGTRAEMDDYLGLGLHIGITGWICDERRGGALRDAVAGLPLDRVLLETDAPYLAPRTLGHRHASRRNEPANLPEVLRVAAGYMGVEPAELAAAATANTERLFGLPRAR
jgi:TatD DNase family protein